MSRKTFRPRPELLAKFPPVSGNAVNGVGERNARPPSPFFWHPADQHAFGDLQQYIVKEMRPASGEDHSFRNPEVDRGPSLIAVADKPVTGISADEWTSRIKAFALANATDDIGITPMQSEYVFDGYTINEQSVILLAVEHDYDALAQAPGNSDNLSAYHDLHKQYNRGAKAARLLTNYIRSQGYVAHAYPGPMADALLMIPAAVQAGLGELGKHGSMIHRTFGSGFRLAAVTTDMPVAYDKPDAFGADEFCVKCQACRRACPPDAILDIKTWVRGEYKWYVDFDKCIPYFGEHYACGICIAVCPWTRPGVASKLIQRLAAGANTT